MSSELVLGVIVDYGAGNFLKEAVSSLEACRVAKIIVVDNGFSEGVKPSSEDILGLKDQKTGIPIEILTPESNRGLGAGVNLAVMSERSFGTLDQRYKYLLICNPDVQASESSVKKLVEILESDKAVGVVGPVIREVDGQIYPSARSFPSVFDAAGHAIFGRIWENNPFTRRYHLITTEKINRKGTLTENSEEKPNHKDQLAYPDWVSGAFMILRLDVFLEVGGFDERFFLYLEDVDLCYKLKELGYKSCYVRGSEVVHAGGSTTKNVEIKSIIAHHVSAFRFEKKHSRGARRLLLGFSFLLLGARCLVLVTFSKIKSR